jgi:hypothetical protein
MSKSDISSGRVATEGINLEKTRENLPDPIKQELNEKQLKIVCYLKYLAESENGEVYTKSKEIADAVGMSPKEVGTNLYLAKECIKNNDCFTIEPWGQTNSTTYRLNSD